MKTVTLECPQCHTKFERCSSDYKYAQKKGRKSFCSLSCCARFNNKNHPRIGKPGNVTSFPDELSPFRFYYRGIRRRTGNDSLTLEELKRQWELQGGICPYTGWKLILPRTTSGWETKNDRTHRASLDRIEPSKGYVLGNVQFIAVIANFAKNDFAEDEMIKFCQAVAHHHR